MCLSHGIANLISSTIMLSGVSVHDYCTDCDTNAWELVSWLCLDSCSAMNTTVQGCIVFLFCIGVFLEVF